MQSAQYSFPPGLLLQIWSKQPNSGFKTLNMVVSWKSILDIMSFDCCYQLLWFCIYNDTRDELFHEGWSVFVVYTNAFRRTPWQLSQELLTSYHKNSIPREALQCLPHELLPLDLHVPSLTYQADRNCDGLRFWAKIESGRVRVWWVRGKL
jgi:hypothetical protein